MTRQHEEIADSIWFRLFGGVIVCLAIFLFLLPLVGALYMVRSGWVVVGSVSFALWAVVDGLTIWQLHRHKYLRLSVSIPCTLMGLAAAFLLIWGT